MKTTITTVALTLLALSPVHAAGASRADRVLAEKPGLVTLSDDDGGRVEVYRSGMAARTLEYHGGPVVKDPVVELIFLGDWSSRAATGRQSDLQRHASEISTSESFQALSAEGVRTTGMLMSTRAVKASGRLNDLAIQRALNDGMTDGTLPTRDENAIRVVFLAPGVQSALRDHVAGRDYASYHSHVQLQDVNVRYVVVPYDTNATQMFEAARQGLLQAIVNPDGDGWY